MKLIRNVNLILEYQIQYNGAILVRDDRIIAAGTEAEVEAAASEIAASAAVASEIVASEAAASAAAPDDGIMQVIDGQSLYAGPGFVDIHVHGWGQHYLYEDPAKLVQHFLSHGETTILPTLYYDQTKEEMLAAIGRIRKVMEKAAGENPADGPFPERTIGGIYMEGPYMNPAYGALADLNVWKGPILAEDYVPLVDAGGEAIKIWAVAPEREGLAEFMTYARKQNPQVSFSAGHSEATPDQVRALKPYGLCQQTHTMNATGRPETIRGTRRCGPDEACLLDDDMFAELISDSGGIHVDPDMQRLILKVKGPDRIILITDSMVSAESNPPQFAHFTDLLFDHNGDLSGSVLTMDRACRNMMVHTGAGLPEIFRMGSLNPARSIHMDQEIGSIRPGKKANLVFTDDRLTVHKVMLEGEFFEA